MSIENSFNRLALQGVAFDDLDFCKQFNLPMDLAYTKEINFAMLDNVYHKNVDNRVKAGSTLAKAKVDAGRDRAEAKAEIMKLLKGK